MQASDWDVDTSSEEGVVPIGVALAPGASQVVAPAVDALAVRTADVDLGPSSAELAVLDLESAIKRRQAIAGVHQEDSNLRTIVIPNLGTAVLQRVGAALALGQDRNSAYQPLLDEFCSTSTSSSLPGRKLMARLVGEKSHGRIAEKLETIVASQYFGSRVWAQSTLAAILGGLQRT